VIIVILVVIAGLYTYIVRSAQDITKTNIDEILQGIGIIIAMIASIIAIAAFDPKRKKIKVKINSGVINKNGAKHKKSDLEGPLANQLSGYPDSFTSHQIYFEVKNISGFTLKKPSLTFCFPNDRRHPHKTIRGSILSNNSNLYNSTRDFQSLEFMDSIIISNSNVPFWNNFDEIKIWIRMVIETMPPFEVMVSINCENAEGISKIINIDPEKLLKLDLSSRA
jgi:hypothetical protein